MIKSAEKTQMFTKKNQNPLHDWPRCKHYEERGKKLNNSLYYDKANGMKLWEILKNIASNSAKR